LCHGWGRLQVVLGALGFVAEVVVVVDWLWS
jgi:hypothetical protein